MKLASIYGISFIGESICAILCRLDNVAIIAKVVNGLKSDALVIENLDLRELGVFSPEMSHTEESKIPIELLVIRAVYLVVNINNIIVATTFREIIIFKCH